MQVHAYAGSVSRTQVPTSHIKNAILVCPINMFCRHRQANFIAILSFAPVGTGGSHLLRRILQSLVASGFDDLLWANATRNFALMLSVAN
jgi:hypothetical protein